MRQGGHLGLARPATPGDECHLRPPVKWRAHLPRWVNRAERDALVAIDGGHPIEAAGRSIRAEVLAVICADPAGLVIDRVEVRGARVIGRLSLKCRSLRHGLRFHRCRFDDGVDLSGADCAEPIEFEGCELGELTAHQINAAKDVRISHCRNSALTLTAADIDGDLVLSGSQLRRRHGYALDGRDMLVEGSVLLNEGFRADGAVTVRGSRIGKDLDCRNARFRDEPGERATDPRCVQPALDASSIVVGGEVTCSYGFHADGEVRLQWAQAHAVCFRQATLNNPGGLALRADGMSTSGGCYLDGRLRATGTVRLVDARIGGEVAATGSAFDNPGGPAIEADRLVAQHVYLDRGFRASGRVSLIGADVARELNCTGGCFHDGVGPALVAFGLRCGGCVYLNDGFTAEGQVILKGATLAGELNCTNGTFRSECSFALDATGLSTGDDVLLDGEFRAVGGVCLRDARVAANVDLRGARLTNTGGPALDAAGLSAGGSLVLRLAAQPSGDVDLSFARAGRLYDVAESWPREGHTIRLHGLTYAFLECDDLDMSDRLRVLSRMPEYHRQPYQQLSKVYREAGKEREARDVAVKGLVELRRRDNLPRHAMVWNWFLQHSVGYGYQMWRALVVLLLLGLVNTVIYHEAEHRGLMVPTNSQVAESQRNDRSESTSQRCPEDYPCFVPYAYSFQLLIPIVNLRQLDEWIPDAGRPWGGLLLFHTWVMIVLGWAFGIAFAGGLNNSLRRD